MQRQLRIPKARRSKPVQRRRRIDYGELRFQVAGRIAAERLSDPEWIAERNAALAFALGQTTDRSAYDAQRAEVAKAVRREVRISRPSNRNRTTKEVQMPTDKSTTKGSTIATEAGVVIAESRHVTAESPLQNPAITIRIPQRGRLLALQAQATAKPQSKAGKAIVAALEALPERGGLVTLPFDAAAVMLSEVRAAVEALKAGSDGSIPMAERRSRIVGGTWTIERLEAALAGPNSAPAPKAAKPKSGRQTAPKTAKARKAKKAALVEVAGVMVSPEIAAAMGVGA